MQILYEFQNIKGVKEYEEKKEYKVSYDNWLCGDHIIHFTIKDNHIWLPKSFLEAGRHEKIHDNGSIAYKEIYTLLEK